MDTDTTYAPVPLHPCADRAGQLAVLVTGIGIPVIARLCWHREKKRRMWVCEWGIFKGRPLKVRDDDEGAWMAEGDTLGPLGKDEGREVVILGGYPVERPRQAGGAAGEGA